MTPHFTSDLSDFNLSVRKVKIAHLKDSKGELANHWVIAPYLCPSFIYSSWLNCYF